MYCAAQKVEVDGEHEKKEQLITQLASLIKLKILFHIAFSLVQFFAPREIDLKHQMQEILKKSSKV